MVKLSLILKQKLKSKLIVLSVVFKFIVTITISLEINILLIDGNSIFC